MQKIVLDRFTHYEENTIMLLKRGYCKGYRKCLIKIKKIKNDMVEKERGRGVKKISNQLFFLMQYCTTPTLIVGRVGAYYMNFAV